MCHNPVIIVFSHLRWDFVYQRPQHLLARLSNNCRVIFIEEPVFAGGEEPTWELNSPEKNVLVARPRTPGQTPGFSDEQIPYLNKVVAELVERENLTDRVV